MDFHLARIDDVNLRLLHLLQENGRISLAELAQKVGRSETTVRERVSALELDGLVLGYQAHVDWARIGLPAHAILRGRCSADKVTQLAARLRRMPHVTGAYFLTGPKPVFAMLRVRDMQHLHSILREELAGGELTDIEAEVTLETLVEERPPNLAPVPVVDLLGKAALNATSTNPAPVAPARSLAPSSQSL